MNRRLKRNRPQGLVWAVALVCPFPTLYLTDLFTQALQHRPHDIELVFLRPVILLPGMVLLAIFIRGGRTERVAHVAAYFLIGLLAMPWYLSLLRVLYRSFGF